MRIEGALKQDSPSTFKQGYLVPNYGYVESLEGRWRVYRNTDVTNPKGRLHGTFRA